MRRLIILIIATVLLSLSCRLFTPASTPGIQLVPTIETDSTLPTFTPIPTLTLTAPMATLPPPTSVAPEAEYFLKEEHQLNGYTIRWWSKPADKMFHDDILTIEATGQVPVRIDMVSAIHERSGEDVNRDSYPELIVETFSGGAHCCFGTQVFSLRETAVLILKKPESNAGGYFEDLENDGVSEFVTFDDSFAYMYCPYAAGVSVKSILAYIPEQILYTPASPRFASSYTEDIAEHEQRAIAIPGELGEWDGSNVCAILPLALDYLYTGQAERARNEFDSRYIGPDSNATWNEVLQVVQSSPLYTP